MSSLVFSVFSQIHLVHMGGLMAVFDEADHRVVLSKLSDCGGTIDVVDEEGMEKGTHHTTFCYLYIY